MATLEEKLASEPMSVDAELGQDILKASTDEIMNRTRLLENEIKVCPFPF